MLCLFSVHVGFEPATSSLNLLSCAFPNSNFQTCHSSLLPSLFPLIHYLSLHQTTTHQAIAKLPEAKLQPASILLQMPHHYSRAMPLTLDHIKLLPGCDIQVFHVIYLFSLLPTICFYVSKYTLAYPCLLFARLVVMVSGSHGLYNLGI